MRPYRHSIIDVRRAVFVVAALLASACSTVKERDAQLKSEHADMCTGLVDLANRIKAAEVAESSAKTASDPVAWETARRNWADAETVYEVVRRRSLRGTSARQLTKVTEDVKQLASNECKWTNPKAAESECPPAAAGGPGAGSTGGAGSQPAAKSTPPAAK